VNIILTGATGFIGSKLAEKLVLDGYSVSIIARLSSQFDALENVLNKVKIYVYDGTYLSLLNALSAAQPAAVIHVASLFLSNHRPSDVVRLVESNISFPSQLVEAMDQIGCRYLVNTGTSWQHYLNEDSNPVNLYAATKIGFESVLLYYTKARKFNVINLKLFDTYGPGDTRPKLFKVLREAARSGNALKMSPGEQLLDLVYIDDVVNAYQVALKRLFGNSGESSYAVSNPKRLKLREVVDIYSNIVGLKINVDWGGFDYRFREVLIPWNKYKMMPDWRARINFDEGVYNMEKDVSICGLLSDTQRTLDVCKRS
jgi:nucleoside-diphosphate-sugar epimerase